MIIIETNKQVACCPRPFPLKYYFWYPFFLLFSIQLFAVRWGEQCLNATVRVWRSLNSARSQFCLFFLLTCCRLLFLDEFCIPGQLLCKLQQIFSVSLLAVTVLALKCMPPPLDFFYAGYKDVTWSQNL